MMERRIILLTVILWPTLICKSMKDKINRRVCEKAVRQLYIKKELKGEKSAVQREVLYDEYLENSTTVYLRVGSIRMKT